MLFPSLLREIRAANHFVSISYRPKKLRVHAIVAAPVEPICKLAQLCAVGPHNVANQNRRIHSLPHSLVFWVGEDFGEPATHAENSALVAVLPVAVPVLATHPRYVFQLVLNRLRNVHPTLGEVAEGDEDLWLACFCQLVI